MRYMMPKVMFNWRKVLWAALDYEITAIEPGWYQMSTNVQGQRLSWQVYILHNGRGFLRTYKHLYLDGMRPLEIEAMAWKGLRRVLDLMPIERFERAEAQRVEQERVQAIEARAKHLAYIRDEAIKLGFELVPLVEREQRN